MPEPIASRVHHIGIAVADLDAAEEIVRDRLGFPLIRRENAAETRGVRAAFGTPRFSTIRAIGWGGDAVFARSRDFTTHEDCRRRSVSR